jgi:hypothetical protein
MMVTLGGIGHFILLIGCIAALLARPTRKKEWWKFVGGGMTTVA